MSVVPNPLSRFPRARQGQMGVEEGRGIARAIWGAIDSDNAAGKIKRAIVAIVDVPGQAFGLHENKLEFTSHWLLPWMGTSLPGHLVIRSSL